MGILIRRVLAPLLLILAGAGLVIYGAKYHATTVIEEHEEEVKIPVPGPLAGMVPPGMPGGFPGFPGGGEPFPPDGRPPDAPPAGEPPKDEGAPGGEQPEAAPDSIFMPPGFVMETLKRTVRNELVLFEPALVRDVTVGGVVRVETGELRRTYSGETPALCPS